MRSEDAYALKEIGNKFFKSKDYELAIDSYTRVIDSLAHHVGSDDLCSLCSQSFGNRALCHVKLHRFKEAISDCDSAISKDPTYAKAWYTKGKCQLDLELYADAYDTFRRLKELWRRDSGGDVDSYMSICLSKLDMRSEQSASDIGVQVVPSSARRSVQISFTESTASNSPKSASREGVRATQQVRFHPALEGHPHSASLDENTVLPLASKQKREIDAIMLAQKGVGDVSATGTVWCVLNAKWYSNWCNYVANDRVMDSEQSFPGPISNNDLLSPDEDLVSSPESTCALRADLLDGDYTMVPFSAWTALHSWYGGGPSFPRIVPETGGIRALLYPTKLISLETARSITELENVGVKKSGTECVTGKVYQPVVSLKNNDSSEKSPNRIRTASGTIAETNLLRVMYNDCGLSRVSSKTGNSCFVCRKLALNHCKACSAVYYCSKTCQGAHWGYHKEWCAHAAKFRDVPFDEFQKKVSVGLRGRVGLYNLGNSCYLNSSLQCLSHIKPLSVYFASNRYLPEINESSVFGTKGVLVREYASLLRDLWFESRPALYPKKLRSLLGRLQPDWAGPGQQDAHEVVDFFLDKLHEDLNRVARKPYTEKVEGDGTNDEVVSENEWEKHSLRDDSAIKDLVGYQIRSEMECKECGKISVSFEYQQTASIEIPRNNTRKVRVIVIPGSVGGAVETPPVEYMIEIDQDESMKHLKSILYGRLPPSLQRNVNDLSLLELSENGHTLERDYSSTQRDFSLSYLREGASLAAYLSSAEIKIKASEELHNKSDSIAAFLYHRLISPPESFGEPIRTRMIGLPQKLEFDLSWSCRKVRMLVWCHISHFIKPESAIGRAVKAAKDAGSKEVLAFHNLIVSILPIRLVTKAGLSKTSSCTSASGSYEAVDEGTAISVGEQHFRTNSKHLFSVNPPFTSEVDLGSLLPNDLSTTVREFVSSSKGPPQYVFLSLDWLGAWEEVVDLESMKPQSVTSSLGDTQPINRSTPYRIGKSGQMIEVSSKLTLERCLLNYTAQEHEQTWYCNVCKVMHENAKKTLKFSSRHLPSVLILTLKRFATRDMGTIYGGRGAGLAAEKIDSYVDFPIEGLNLSPYCSGSIQSGQAIYDLFAVCNHYGRMGFGHYSAYARDWLADGQLSSQWISFDDDDVRLVNEECVQSNGAYILYYKRRGK